MSWNDWNRRIRQSHRWLSVAMTAAVIVNFIAVMRGRYTRWLGLSAVLPFALELVTGLYLFGLPFANKWRERRHTH